MEWFRKNQKWLIGAAISLSLLFGLVLSTDVPSQNHLELAADKPIVQLINGKSPDERDSIVADAWVAVGKRLKTPVGDGLEIEIVGIEKLEKGVAVFARAWQDGKQIGFGRDGTVDIERFQFFGGLPFMVPDGTKHEEVDQITGQVVSVDNLKEDVLATIYEQIAYAISVKKEKKVGGSVVEGRVGRTTSTFYPAAGANSPVDGYIQLVYPAGSGKSWSEMHDSADGNGAFVTDGSESIELTCDSGENKYIVIKRPMVLFNTSSIGSDKISSATLGLRGNSKANNHESASPSINIYSASPAATDSLANGDYSQFGTTAFSSSISYDDFTTASYNSFVLNSNGLAAINTGGISKFGVREANYDAPNNTLPWSSLKSMNMRFYFADSGSLQPKLVVEHEAVSTFVPRIIMF